MARRESFSFVMEADDLDGLRSALLAAQEYHMERARHWRLEGGPGRKEAIAQATSAAAQCRGWWALLAGVRSCECQGEVPVGRVPRDELLRFLNGQ